MSGYIDLHNHLLPGLDDGPEELEQSLALAGALEDLGYSTIAATPHCKQGSWEPSEEDIEAAADLLREALRKKGLSITLLTGAEHNADGLFVQRLETGPLKAIGEQAKALLVEFPVALSDSVKLEMLFQLKVKGFIPVMAHPERAMFEGSQIMMIKEWCQRGGLTQINLGSLVGQFGRRTKRLSRELVEQGLVHVAASDAHLPGEIGKYIKPGIKFLKRYGTAHAELLLRGNGASILDGTFEFEE